MRRGAVVMAAVMAATLAVSVPPAYAAPALLMSHGCLPSGETVLVRFYVRDQAGPTEVFVQSGSIDTGALPASDSSTYSGNAEVRASSGGVFGVRPRGGGTTTSTFSVTAGGCPSISAADGCLPAATVTDMPVRGTGFPSGEITLTFDRFGSSATQGSATGPSFDVVLRVVPRSAGTYFLTAAPVSGTQRTVSTTVQACPKAPPPTAAPPPPPTTAPAPTVVVVPPAPNAPSGQPSPPVRIPSRPATTPIPVANNARMALDPVLGPPGSTTHVTGSGFPAGAVLNLRWVPGNGEFTVRVGSDGRFQTDALVMRKDITGPRVLEVAGAIPAVRANYLVVRETGGWDDSVFVR